MEKVSKLNSINLQTDVDEQYSLIKRKGRGLPFLKWAGGKGQMIPALARFVPSNFDRYIEPFLGGGALFFYLNSPTSLLNDLNEELMHAYRMVQQQVDELINLLHTYPYSKDFYYQMRAQDPTTLAPVVRAARFIYLNRTCFNGLHRVNKQGQFNVPFGAYTNPVICDETRLRAASHMLQDVKLFCENYKQFLEREARTGDFIYLDPPYQPVSKHSDFKRYTSPQFYEYDQIDLAALIRVLANKGCYILASNSDTPLVRQLYQGFEFVDVQARRNINKNGNGRGAIGEVLIICRQ
jgi:DNA adenine methylase